MSLHYLITKTLASSQNTFKKIENFQFDGFPKLDIEIIRKKITFGYYQLEQAYGYLSEHFESNEDYQFLVSNNMENDEDSKIVFAKIQSRHSNSVKYKVFVRFKPNSNQLDDITWVCSCKTGKRTLGCCSHIAALIYFMAIGRFNITNIPKPGLRLKDVIIPIAYDSDENEDILGIETSSNDMIKRSLSINSEIENNPTASKK
ncbi:vacuolar sorting-associated 13c [Brachionus plicatilis]|uniref:Vacuolar sorting-associated 13c n=1 Tax=Brachionus plicatilis TaxID=10195 RepID=A0A3M7RE39_BRAPC|nr:vacuolar sorting-associated 13c [Brachionus plicatilis]